MKRDSMLIGSSLRKTIPPDTFTCKQECQIYLDYNII